MRFSFAFACAFAFALFGVAWCDKIKGATFSTGHYVEKYRQPWATDSLRDLKATGANTVMINAYMRQWGLHATNATRITDDESLRYIIAKCKNMGFSVFLKPVVEVPGSWRGNLEGTPEWFANIYRPFIKDMAVLAQQEKVDIFAIGSEYKKMEWKTWEWLRVINLVKKYYKGTTTYVSNHDGYWNVKFWKHLDFISLSGYFVLVGGSRFGPPLSLERTKEILGYRAKDLDNWRRANGLESKPVCFGEMGYQSKGNGINWRIPFAWHIDAPVSFWQQTVLYEAFFSVFMPKSWVNGIVVWNWEVEPWAGKSKPTVAGYTPQNKPALKVMRSYFRKVYLSVTGLEGLLK